jgi:hypothetical protein
MIFEKLPHKYHHIILKDLFGQNEKTTLTHFLIHLKPVCGERFDS